MDPKIIEIKKEYEQLKIDLTDQLIVSDLKKLKAISQRYSQLEPLVKKITELELIDKKIAGAKDAVLNETDEELIIIAQEELTDLTNTKENLEKEIAEELKPQDPLAKKNIIVEIRAGAGGDEASLFCR